MRNASLRSSQAESALSCALQVPRSSTWVRKNITVSSTVMAKAHQNL